MAAECNESTIWKAKLSLQSVNLLSVKVATNQFSG
jgi:hypothetical protein